MVTFPRISQLLKSVSASHTLFCYFLQVKPRQLRRQTLRGKVLRGRK